MMEHRKRSMMQHKLELSTLLRIIIANKKSEKFQYDGRTLQNLTKTIASEAIESLKNCDHCEISVTPETNMQKDGLEYKSLISSPKIKHEKSDSLFD
ncbi:MAG TPA: hypothetical protein VN958_04770 [Chitinophagaceae bacterium]|nr:hypothetical protein [Chitinophagaceae bacterium]